MIIDLHRSLVALLIAFAATAAFAQERAAHPAGEHNHPEPGRQEQNAPGVLSLLPGDAVTEHSIDTASRQAFLHRDRRHLLAVRPIGRALGCGLLHCLCRSKR